MPPLVRVTRGSRSGNLGFAGREQAVDEPIDHQVGVIEQFTVALGQGGAMAQRPGDLEDPRRGADALARRPERREVHGGGRMPPQHGHARRQAGTAGLHRDHLGKAAASLQQPAQHRPEDDVRLGGDGGEAQAVDARLRVGELGDEVGDGDVLAGVQLFAG